MKSLLYIEKTEMGKKKRLNRKSEVSLKKFWDDRNAINMIQGMNNYLIEIKEDANPSQEQEIVLSVMRNYDKSIIWLNHVF